MPEKTGYRIEQMMPQPEELRGVYEPGGFEWAIIRNHDDELISVYSTREEAEAAMEDE